MRVQAWDTLQDSTDNSSIDKAETSLDWQEHFLHFQAMWSHGSENNNIKSLKKKLQIKIFYKLSCWGLIMKAN